MGYDPNTLPEHIRRRLPASDPASTAAAERRLEKVDDVAEGKMHDQFEGWLRIRELKYVHSRMDRKSTIEEGWPDFTIVYQRRVAMIEFKAGSNVLSTAQEDVIKALAAGGTPTKVCYGVTEAIEWTKEQLGIL